MSTLMLRRASLRSNCSVCSRHLLRLFVGDLIPDLARCLPVASKPATLSTPIRRLHATRLRSHREPRDYIFEEERTSRDDEDANAKESEAVARRARQKFGDHLPIGYLSQEEYQVYKRLYGEPILYKGLETSREDGLTLSDHEKEGSTEGNTVNVHALNPESENSGHQDSLEAFAEDQEYILTSKDGDNQFESEDSANYLTNLEFDGTGGATPDHQEVWMLKDLGTAKSLTEQQAREQIAVDTTSSSSRTPTEEVTESEETQEEVERTHPYTSSGRFSTYPRSVILPASELVQPIQQQLADHAKYEHLIDAAQSTFGGHAFQDSNATPSKRGRHFEQKPIPLAASQFNMSQIEANLFISTIIPGAFATTMSILVEVRKRLGSTWLADLLQKPKGPRVLDVGGGGAGILAWREVLKAEHQRLHEESGRVVQGSVKTGSATVLAGSRGLQAAISSMLDDTTFIPRLPDFNRLEHLKSVESGGDPSRKQYDVIIAPYSIWQIEEDYMKKNHVENLWSLLDPNGGVLILAEKGLPRGFEAIAEARNVLLKYHIKGVRHESQHRTESPVQEQSGMEEGMIVAPCTNHTKCPLYKIPGEMTGRRDFCAFQQRFERPPFLHRIHGSPSHSQEDISFSYLAVRRGKDLRRELGFKQDAFATEQAFKGYENAHEPPQNLALPRIVSSPLKRTGHVTMDMCTPQGTYERWTTPKSFSKRAYRDARKSSWGDLWALGAKTRFVQQAKTGYPRGEKPSKVIKALNELGPEAEGMRRAAMQDLNNPVKLKREDKGWKSKIGRKSKYGDKPMTRKADKVEEV